MDRRPGVLIPALLAAASANCSKSPPQADEPVRFPPALEWLRPESQAVYLLTTRPAACRLPAATPAEAKRRARGRLAFESPALLGGQAARRGLSCATCHRNGRGNPHFKFPGVSGAPGTADVTTGFFSKQRGDGRFNPIAIPDLAVRSGAKFPVRRGKPFREFVRGLIVEEFQGEPPPPALFADLLAYLDGLDMRGCADPSRREPVTWRRDWRDAVAAVAEAGRALAGNDPRAARLLLRAARLRLETLHIRYSAPGARAVQQRLVEASRQLERAMAALVSDPEAAGRMIADWGAAKHELQGALARRADRSFYNRRVLARAVAARH